MLNRQRLPVTGITELWTGGTGAGCETGELRLEMLVGQARQAFEWWTGVRPPADVMREGAVRKLAEFSKSRAEG